VRTATATQTNTEPGQEALEVLDLRHFSAAQMRPLLRDEAERWQRRLHWDYTRASGMLLEYIDTRVLPGFVGLLREPGAAARSGRIAGYTFAVFEAAKAVVGDVYALGETEQRTNPVCERLLEHLLEMLQATPGTDRIESQLLMFPIGALAGAFAARGFQSYPRLFMACDLAEVGMAAAARRPGPGPWQGQGPDPGHPGMTLQAWRPEFYDAAAELIHRCYAGHMDAGINDQYRSLHGAQRFLHNIIRFPGCGVFEPECSYVLRQAGASKLQGLVLCSRVRTDYGHITQLCVSPEMRGHGLGQVLLRQCAGQAARSGMGHLSLTVTEANDAAVTLYLRHGFQTLHRFEAMVWEKQ